jgi:hypothetical protein
MTMHAKSARSVSQIEEFISLIDEVSQRREDVLRGLEFA